MAYPRGGRSAAGGAAYDSYLEGDNDAQVNLLAGKVGQLKELSIAIGSHVREDNKLLGEIDNSFDTTGGLLGGTMKRLGNLTSSNDNRHMLYLVVFVVFVFLLVYKLTRS